MLSGAGGPGTYYAEVIDERWKLKVIAPESHCTEHPDIWFFGHGPVSKTDEAAQHTGLLFPSRRSSAVWLDSV